MKKLRQLLMLLTCIMVILVSAMQRDGKVFGHEMNADNKEVVMTEDSMADVATTLDDGTIVVNTTSLCKDVQGYAGTVPMEVSVKDGIVQDVKPLPNEETPDFFDEAKVIVVNWKGKSVEDALQLDVDAVSGATFSSNAIIRNVKAALAYVAENGDALVASGGGLATKDIIGLIVVLMAALIPLFIKNKTMRLVQIILNVAVLGFWCGTFLNYTFFLRVAANGFNMWMDLVPVIMLITAFIYPLFGKKGYYCANVCPFGGLQDLAGKASKKKIKISKPVLKYLTWFRQLLWIVLMSLMIAGLWFDWINYEFFTAFIFQSAPIVVICLAVLSLIISVFIPRPYCRFVCPTGTLMKVSEDHI